MRYLLAVSVGPVQGFIAAARRTRDLWGGSLLLSEISKAAARAIHQACSGSLVFPAPENAEVELAANSRFLVANVLLAELTGDEEAVRTTAEGARAAAERRWQEFVGGAYAEVAQVVDAGRWEQQRHQVLEVYAAWEAYEGEGYRESRAQVMRRLAARKSCRDFLPWVGAARVPKSSLDGARESVWRSGEGATGVRGGLGARLRLSRQEHLDVVGVTKRLGLGAQQFPSVARIAAEPWLRSLPPASGESLRRAAASLVGEGLVQLPPGRFPQFADFPFEADLLYPARLRELTTEPGEEVQAAIASVYRSHGQPSPYLALLLADGDKMGATIGGLDSPEEHRRFSQALAQFAHAAETIVRNHHGALVYAGGDDVLAMLPISGVLSCAAALRDRFRVALRDWQGPTLSVGITIGHCLEDLEDLLARVRSAERVAKQPDRNGLAIHYAARGQEGRFVRLRWRSNEVGGDDAHEEMLRLQALFAEGLLPDKIAYEISLLARHYGHWEEGNADLLAAMHADAMRVLRRKPGVSEATKRWLAGWIGQRLGSAADLKALADQLLIAQHMAAQTSARGTHG